MRQTVHSALRPPGGAKRSGGAASRRPEAAKPRKVTPLLNAQAAVRRVHAAASADPPPAPQGSSRSPRRTSQFRHPFTPEKPNKNRNHRPRRAVLLASPRGGRGLGMGGSGTDAIRDAICEAIHSAPKAPAAATPHRPPHKAKPTPPAAPRTSPTAAPHPWQSAGTPRRPPADRSSNA